MSRLCEVTPRAGLCNKKLTDTCTIDLLIPYNTDEQSRLSSVKTGLHVSAHTQNTIWRCLGSRSVASAHHIGANSLSFVWQAGAHDYLSEKWGNASKHSMDIWSENTPTPLPLTSNGFGSETDTRCLKDAAQMCTAEAHVTQLERALTQHELAPLTHVLSFTSESSTVFIVFHTGINNTLIFIQWTQEASLVPADMNNACDAWLGCIRGLLSTAVIRFISIFTRRIFHPHPIHVHSLHVCVFSICMCICPFSVSMLACVYISWIFVTFRQWDHSLLGGIAKQRSWCVNAVADNSMCCVRKWDV